MKDNIVFWGADDKDQKILVALRLRAVDKKVDIWTFEEKLCKKNFLDEMFGDWESIDVQKFPEGHQYIERDASSSELLPTSIKTTTKENTDLIARAEKEWFVKVLSLRLYEMIKAEVSALKEQVLALKEYDKSYWDSCKAYWDKIMTNHHDHNLSREQASELREIVNASFERLKELMADTNKQYEEESHANFFQLNKKIEEIGKRLEQKPGTAKSLFSELRKLQDGMKEMRLGRTHYRDIRKQMNGAFEAVKKKMAAGNVGHLEKRINGLKGAIEKISKSVDWDKGSIEFQNRRSNSVHAGQLEMQLREAKIQMIKARIESKEAKLADMKKTLAELEKKLSKSQKNLDKTPKENQKKKPSGEKKNTDSKDKVKSKGGKAPKPAAKKEVKPAEKNDQPANKATAEKPTKPDSKSPEPVSKSSDSQKKIDKPEEKPESKSELKPEPKKESKPAEPVSKLTKPAVEVNKVLTTKEMTERFLSKKDSPKEEE